MNLCVIFVVELSPTLRQTWYELTNNFNHRDWHNLSVNAQGFVSVLMAIFGISWLVLLQLQTAFSFVIDRGNLDDALKFSLINAGISFVMILLAGGIIAAYLAPHLLWPDSTDIYDQPIWGY